MRKYESEALQVIYEGAEGMFRDGIISAEQFHQFDDCLISDSDTSSPVAVPQYEVASGRGI